MRSSVASDQEVVRFKSLYWLFSCALGRTTLSAQTIERKILDAETDKKAQRVLDLLQRYGVTDYEGYLRLAFRCYDHPYLEMLQSETLVKQYLDTLPRELADLQAEFRAACDSIRVRCLLFPGKNEQRALQWALTTSGANPLLRWWMSRELDVAIEDDLLYPRAVLTYRLWPFGYDTAEAWRPCVAALLQAEKDGADDNQP